MSTDIVLDNNIAKWNMPRMEGDLGGTYIGTFTFKCYLSPLTQLQAGREFRELLGNLGSQAPNGEIDLAFALTQLKHRIITAPAFWTSTLEESGIAGNIGDMNVVSAVLDASIRSENLFKEKVAKERELLLDRSIKVGEEILVERQKEEG